MAIFITGIYTWSDHNGIKAKLNKSILEIKCRILLPVDLPTEFKRGFENENLSSGDEYASP